MSTQLRNQPMTPVSPISELSSLREENMHAVRMQRVDTPTAINLSSPVSSPMPSWLREAVAERKRQLAASRALASPDPDMGDKDDLLLAPPSKLTKQHFGIPVDDRDNHHHFVSEWLNGLPERLIDGWQTVLREEVQETFGNGKARRQTRNSQNMDSQLNEQDTVDNERRETFFEDVESEEFDYCPGAAPIADGYSSADDDEEDDEFLVKVLLGRKRLMQAESSMKRLKMGLKHVTSGICAEFSNITDTERTQELLAEVDNTFKDVVRKRLSNATAIRQRADNNDGQNRRRLRAMRDKDPGFILRVYNEREIKELKTTVADILGMDERSGDTEGTDWFWNMLPRLLELREDMAEAEREFARQRKAVKNSKLKRYSTFSQRQSFIVIPLSVWDLYYHQYIWMQSALNFRPIGSWYAFSIPVEDEAETEDWQLRIEQRVWLQEHFSLTLGTKRWLPFRQAMIPAH